MKATARLYCSRPSYDDAGELVGTCGSYVPGRTRVECEQRAAEWGWQVQPQPLCPGHRAMAGRQRPVLEFPLPPLGCEALVRLAADQEAAALRPDPVWEMARRQPDYRIRVAWEPPDEFWPPADGGDRGPG